MNCRLRIAYCGKFYSPMGFYGKFLVFSLSSFFLYFSYSTFSLPFACYSSHFGKLLVVSGGFRTERGDVYLLGRAYSLLSYDGVDGVDGVIGGCPVGKKGAFHVGAIVETQIPVGKKKEKKGRKGKGGKRKEKMENE